MAEKLMKGNEAIAEAAIRAGVDFFAGYPITPSTELLEYMSRRMPEENRVFVQGESEVASSSMIFTAAQTGARAMTATSGPGLALMCENMGVLALARLPAVFVDVQRAASNITPEQSDYNYVTKSPGHNGLRGLVYAPGSVQEAVDLTYMAFDKADEYMIPTYIMSDSMIGQMEEAIKLPEPRSGPRPNEGMIWPTGCEGRNRILGRNQPMPFGGEISGEDALEISRMEAYKMYRQWVDTEVMYEEYMMEDAEYIIIAYGSSARICKDTIRILRSKGIKAGLFRPITLYPFPEKQIAALRAKAILVVEMALPPMFYDDVRLHMDRSIPHDFYARCGGNMVDEEEAAEAMLKLIKEVG